MQLNHYRTLGRSGLLVSPLGLGTMPFGARRWGTEEEASKEIFNAYIDAGGNFIDTADVYSGGGSEEQIGRYISDRKLRDSVVIATKFGWNNAAPNPHAGGNGRKKMVQAVEASLKRLNTDYIDLWWMHVWDGITPVEEVLQTFGNLVQSGKIRYYGLSNIPAWYATKMAVLSTAHGVPGPVAMQVAYSLIERNHEREHFPAAKELGLGIVPWSPLGASFLTGKYKRTANGVEGEGRLSGANPFGDTLFTNRNWTILEKAEAVAAEMNRPVVQVALAWALAQPGVVSPLVAVSKLKQLDDHLAALDIQFTPEQLKALDEASTLEPVAPWAIFSGALRKQIFGGNEVKGWA